MKRIFYTIQIMNINNTNDIRAELEQKIGQQIIIERTLGFGNIQTNFKATLLKIEGLKLTFSVVISAEYLNQILDDFIKTQYEREKPTIAGFSKGRMPPLSVLKDHYITKFRQGKYDTMRNMFDYLLVTEIKRSAEYVKSEFNIIDSLPPQFLDLSVREEFNQEKASYKYEDYAFTFRVELLPQAPNIDLTQITIDQPQVKASDVDVRHSMNEWAAYNTKAVDLKQQRPIETGDTVTLNLSIAGKKDELEDMKVIVGDGKLNPECEKQLLGKSIGDKFAYKFTVPNNIKDTSLQGRSYDIEGVVRNIQATEHHKIDNEMAQVFGCDNVDECKKKFEISTQDYINKCVAYVTQYNFKQSVGKSYDIELPTESLNNILMHRHNQLIKMLGFELPYPMTDQAKEAIKEVMTQMFGYDYDQWFENEEQAAKIELKADLFIAFFIKEHKVQVTQDELNQAITAQAHNFAGEIKEAVEFYTTNQQEYNALVKTIHDKKVFDIVLEKVKKEYKNMSFDQLKRYVTIDCNPNPTLIDKEKMAVKDASQRGSNKKQVDTNDVSSAKTSIDNATVGDKKAKSKKSLNKS